MNWLPLSPTIRARSLSYASLSIPPNLFPN